MYYIKLWNVCIAKETMNKIKFILLSGRSTFVHYLFNEGLISKIWKKNNSYNSTSKTNKQTKTKQNKTKKHLIKEWAEDMNRHISKWDIQMANGHMKIFSTSLIIRWKQTKTGMRHHPTSVKTAIIKMIRNNKYVDVVKKRESVIPSVSEGSHYGKQSGDSLKSKNRTTI